MKAKLLLAVFVLQTICALTFADGANHGGDRQYVKKLNHLRKEKIIREMKKPLTNIDPPAGPYCQSVVAYFTGTLQNKNFSSSTYDIQFQLKLEVTQNPKRIQIITDEWNNEFSNSGQFELDFYYSDSHQFCDIGQDDCTASPTKNATNFRLDLNVLNDGNFYHLLYFDYFNNSFPLNKARDGCTKHQLDTINNDWSPDLDQLTMCVCCDSYNPSVLSGCPANNWNPEPTCKPEMAVTTPKSVYPEPTCKPELAVTTPKCECPEPTCKPEVVTTTPKIVTQKPTQPPTLQNISCKSVVGYYNGVFKNTWDDSMPVEFELRLQAKDAEQKIYYRIDGWNEQKTRMSDIELWAGSTYYDWIPCDPPNSTDCTLPYVTGTDGDFWVDMHHYINGNWQNQYRFLYFPPPFNNTFTLYNAVGQCTKNQPRYDSGDLSPDTTKFNYCLCCGDDYKPDPSLGCPKNPWA